MKHSHMHILMRNKKSNNNPRAFSLPVIAGLLSALFIFPNYAVARDNSTSNLNAIFTHNIHAPSSSKHFEINEDTVNITESQNADLWQYGLADSSPTIKEKSQYLYAGYKWGLSNAGKAQPEQHYLKLTGGLHREVDDEQRMSLNELEATPLVRPTYGYQNKNYITEVSLEKGSTLQLNFGFIF